jgi:hypothetical protein
MADYKRIDGDYTIKTLKTGGNIVMDTSNARVSGNLSVTGNIVGNNSLTAARATVTGNVTANLFIGNGSQLTGVVASANIGIATQLTNGTTTLDIPLSDGNIVGNINGVSNVFIFRDSGVNVAGYVSSNTVLASENITGGNILTGGLVSATGNVTGGNLIVTGNIVLTGSLVGIGASPAPSLSGFSSVNAIGNVTGGNILTAGLVSATGNVTANFFIGNGSLLTGVIATDIGTLSSLSVTGNINTGNLRTAGLVTATGNVTGGNILTAGSVTATGAIVGSNLSVSTGTITCGNIVNANANGVGNIGSSTTYFNTLFAKATSAEYADLAEHYESDFEYAPGTVVVFGGSKEITVTNAKADARVAGAVSTNPAYLMNTQCAGLPIALRGRVPVQVVGPVTKGDSLVTSSEPGYAESVGQDTSCGQAVFAKSLETNLETGKKTITAVIL